MAVQMTFGGYQFDPVPQVTLSVSHIRDEAGNLINIQHVASLEGQLVSIGKANQGPADLLDQINTMRKALSDCSGCQRFLLNCDGTTLIDAYAMAKGLTFSPSQDNWVFTAGYSVEIEWHAVSDLILMAATGIDTSCLKCLTTTNESWEIRQAETPAVYTATGTCPTGIPQVLEISHNVSAKGYNCCISGGVETLGYVNAKQWVEQRIGFSDTVLSDISGLTFRLNPNAFVAYNHNRQVQINKSAGEYAVTETWTVIGDSGARAYLEDYSVESVTDQSSRFTTVTVQGTITGLEQRNFVHALTASKWNSAQTGWAEVEPLLYSRASCLSSSRCPLNSEPISSSVTRNVTTGVIAYNYTYNSKLRLIPNSLTESVSVSDTLTSTQVIPIPIIGRRAGPILYDTRQNNQRERSVSISILMSQGTGCFPTTGTVCYNFNAMYSAPPTSGVNALLCCLEQNLSGVAQQYYRVGDSTEWNPLEGQYTRNVQWLWSENCLTASGPASFC